MGRDFFHLSDELFLIVRKSIFALDVFACTVFEFYSTVLLSLVDYACQKEISFPDRRKKVFGRTLSSPPFFAVPFFLSFLREMGFAHATSNKSSVAEAFKPRAKPRTSRPQVLGRCKTQYVQLRCGGIIRDVWLAV